MSRADPGRFLPLSKRAKRSRSTTRREPIASVYGVGLGELEYEKLVRAGAGDGAAPLAAGDGAAVAVTPVAEFFELQLRHVKGPAAGEPFRLEPWQRSFADEFVRVDGEGRRVFKRGLLGVARGNGKSPLAAGLALRELFATDDCRCGRSVRTVTCSTA